MGNTHFISKDIVMCQVDGKTNFLMIWKEKTNLSDVNSAVANDFKMRNLLQLSGLHQNQSNLLFIALLKENYCCYPCCSTVLYFGLLL